MNISFLKLRVANDPWIIIDSAKYSCDWASFARLACSRSAGCFANGVILLESEKSSIKTLNYLGQNCMPSPAASLCAARWLFDAGRSGRESIQINTEYGESTVEALDSRTFGIDLGEFEVKKSSQPGLKDSLASINISMKGSRIPVMVFDGPIPQGRRRQREPGTVLACSISRKLTRVYSSRQDILLAASAANIAARTLDMIDEDSAMDTGGDLVFMQQMDGASIFAMAEAKYCLSGELWIQDSSLESS